MQSDADDVLYGSNSVLLDAISQGFSYPSSDFYFDLTCGGYLRVLRNGCEATVKLLSLAKDLADMETGMEKINNGRTREDLESEYIELFEHDHRQEPLRLCSGFYLQEDGGRLKVLQRLTRLYRAYGLDMEDGVEHADHLSVILEFLGMLYRYAAELKQKGDESGLNQVAADIHTIMHELEWTGRLEDGLIARGRHPFYLPLSRVLRTVLASLE